MSASLKGKRILVTRPTHQAEKLAAPLRSLGAEVLLLPMLEVLPPADAEPLHAAVKNLQTYRWIVFTSANAVRAVAAELDAQSLSLPEFSGLRVAVVGGETAHALSEIGRKADVIPKHATAADLAVALVPLIKGQTVLLPRQPGAADGLANSLDSAGAVLHRVEAYRTALPGDAAAQLKTLFAAPAEAPDVVTFTSAQSARNFFELIRQAGIALPTSTVIASIGPTTTDALKALGAAPPIEARNSTMQSFADAIADYFAAR